MGWLAVGAGIAFGLAIGMLTVFFITSDERYDRVAEWAFVAFALLAVPTIVSVGDRLGSGPAVGAITVVGVVAVIGVGLAELGTTLRLVDFRRVAPLVTIAFLVFIGWIGIVSAFAVAGTGLSAGQGWLGLVSVGLGILVVGLLARQPGALSGERAPGGGAMAAFAVPMLGLVAWLVWLGLGS